MESGREHSKTHMVAFTSQICTFLHFLLIFHFYNFHITFYHFSFLFFSPLFCWRKTNLSTFFLFFTFWFFFYLICMFCNERVYLLFKGGFRSFFKYVHAISHVVCVSLFETHSLTNPHYEKLNKKKRINTYTHLKLYIHYTCVPFPPFFFSFIWFIILNQRWITKDDPHLPRNFRLLFHLHVCFFFKGGGGEQRRFNTNDFIGRDKTKTC